MEDSMDGDLEMCLGPWCLLQLCEKWVPLINQLELAHPFMCVASFWQP